MGEILAASFLGVFPISFAVACSASSGDAARFSPTAMPTVAPAPSATGTTGPLFDPTPIPFSSPTDLGADCDPTRSVRSDGPALLVKEPEVLARFPLERTLSQIIATADGTMAPAELLQRLFDTDNTAADAAFADNRHCDDVPNLAFGDGKPVDCPRAEGRLAKSAALLAANDPDGFVPVALVNRFDLLPNNFTSCGEYRIVYAKRSGLTDPNDRLFLIFEGALANAGPGIASCRGVAEFWAGLEGLATAEERALRLDTFFYGGFDGHPPVVHARNYGFQKSDCTYEGVCGQVRVAEGMQAPLRFREFRLSEGLMDQTTGTSWPMHFEPRPLINSPRPELFDPAVAGAVGTQFRFSFTRELAGLVSPEIPRLRLQIFTDYAAGESSVDGPARPDYVARVVNSAAGTAFAQAIADGIAAFPQQPPCPADDPLTPAAILERATALTCAGCHAPQRLLSPERRVGCGQVWPLSLGEAHIDEQGRLSPALTDLLLPHRASVLTTYLQACDPDAIVRNLQPSPSLAFPECLIGGTEVTMADGSLKAIERIEPGEMVLSLDEASGRTVSARVERAFVRADTDGLIVVNGSVVATPNHAFRTERGWIAAEFLRANDVLVRARSTEPGEAAGLVAESAPVSALEMRRGSVTTYNLAVVRHHAFFAGGVLVHDGP